MSKGKGKKEEVAYAWTDGELESPGSLVKVLPPTPVLVKWMRPTLGTTMNPETRTSSVLMIEDLDVQNVVRPKGDKVEPRRADWDNVKFN